MSITVSRLVRRGYIAQNRDKSDARRVGLRLTTAGLRVKEQNTILDPDLMREMFRLAPPRELETALRGIEYLAKYANVLLRRRKRVRDR